MTAGAARTANTAGAQRSAPGRHAARQRVLAAANRLGVKLIPRLPERAARLLSGGRTITIDGNTLDPSLQLMLAAQRRTGLEGLVVADNVAATRAGSSQLTGALDEPGHRAGLRHAVGEGFLAEHVPAGPEGGGAHRLVPALADRDHHGIEVALRLEQAPEIPVLAGLRDARGNAAVLPLLAVPRGRTGLEAADLARLDVAERRDVRALLEQRRDEGAGAVAAADDGHVEATARRGGAAEDARGDDLRTAERGGGAQAQKRTAGMDGAGGHLREGDRGVGTGNSRQDASARRG